MVFYLGLAVAGFFKAEREARERWQRENTPTVSVGSCDADTSHAVDVDC